jgi:hypothetical protein
LGNADVRNLQQVRRVNCRCCWGVDGTVAKESMQTGGGLRRSG